ncbi:hypothetical protein AS219_02535 [Neorickettsia sp. 179522]|nr:hypothetical protein AS219_02535 [Neorickettsia sp. 179522]
MWEKLLQCLSDLAIGKCIFQKEVVKRTVNLVLSKRLQEKDSLYLHEYGFLCLRYVVLLR